MKTTRPLVAFVLLLALPLAACTGGEDTGAKVGTGGTGGTGATGPVATGPTPAETFTGPPGTAVYAYANAGLEVTLDVDGTEGVLQVANGTDRELPEPGFYILDARDGHRVDGEVADPTPVPAGDSSEFAVSFSGIEVRNIGAVVLLFGEDNYGLFVRTG